MPVNKDDSSPQNERKNLVDIILRSLRYLSILFGVILILLSLIISLEYKDYFWEIIAGLLRELGITFIIIGTMLIVFEKHLNRFFEIKLERIEEINTNIDGKLKDINDNVWAINGKIKAREDSRFIYDMGLKAICTSAEDDSIFRNMNSAYSIDIMSNTARTFFGKYLGKMEDAIVNNGCRVRILLSNPKNEFWKFKCAKEGLCPGLEIEVEINHVKTMLEKRINSLKEHKPPLKAGSIEMRMYSNLPTCSITIINNEIARHIPYLPFAHSGEVPNYDVTKEGKLFKEYQEAFERVWNQSTSETVLKMDFGYSQ